MSARTRLFAGPVHGPTHRSAPTDLIEISINPKTTGGDRAPPLPVDRGAQWRADVPKAWLPPTKFRAEIWGVSHGHRPLRKTGKPHRPPGPAAQSGASAPALITRGWDRGRDHPPKYPATSDNPSVALRATAPVAVKILCSLIAHRILTAATRSPRCICPRQRSVRSPFAQGSLWPCGGRGKGRTYGPPLLIPPARAAPAVPGQSPGIPYR